MRRLAIVILAFLLVCACTDSRRERMLALLHSTNAANKADSVFTTDTAFLPVVDYFDRHGTANERMLAHYLLGRIYSDMGEAPAALQAFHDAIDCADTTATDCDYHQLMIIHGQMSELFLRQNLPEYANVEIAKACEYAQRIGDRNTYLINVEGLVASYYEQSLYDSVYSLASKLVRLYAEENNNKSLSYAVMLPIRASLYQKQYTIAKRFLDKFDVQSFDSTDSLERNILCAHYADLGKYYTGTGKRDSAAFYFQKSQSLCRNFSLSVYLSRGLYEYYKNTLLTDSLVKYTELFTQLTDSSVQVLKTNALVQAQSMYDYHRHQELARVEETKAARAKLMLTNAVAVIALLLVAMVIVFRYYYAKRKEEYRNFKAKLHELTKTQSDQMQLQAEQYDKLTEEKNLVIAQLSEELKSYHRYRKGISQSDVEELIKRSAICNRFHKLATSTKEFVSDEEWEQLMNFVNEKMPAFYSTINKGHAHLRHDEYRLCMLVRLHFAPYEICNLMGESSSNVANMRSRLHMKVFGEKGSSKDFDKRIQQIS